VPVPRPDVIEAVVVFTRRAASIDIAHCTMGVPVNMDDKNWLVKTELDRYEQVASSFR
jgi:hypothetical protein